MKAHFLPLLLLLAAPGSAGDIPATSIPLLPSPDEAPIAVLVDLSSGQTLFARQPDARMLPASMTKAMSALVAFDLIAAGKLSEDRVFTVRPGTAARLAGRGSSLALRPGERVAVRDLLRGMTTVSANDAAVALAEGALGSEAAWTAAMNARAKTLGMTGSRFTSANGLPDGGRTFVTGRDMIRLGEALIVEHPVLYRRYFGHKAMIWRGQRLASHDPFTGAVPGADGIKTGHTREAGYTFLGAVNRGGRRLLVVVGRVPSEAGRAAAARALVEWGYAAWDSRAFLDSRWIVGAARVQDGDAREVPLAVPRAFSLAVPKGTNPRISASIVYVGPLRAPIAKGATVAQLVVEVAGQGTHRLPLVATRSVGKAGPFDRVVNGLLGLFA